MDFAIQFLTNGRDLESGEFQSTEALGDLGHPSGGYTLDHLPAGGLQTGDEGLLATLVALKSSVENEPSRVWGTEKKSLPHPSIELTGLVAVAVSLTALSALVRQRPEVNRHLLLQVLLQIRLHQLP